MIQRETFKNLIEDFAKYKETISTPALEAMNRHFIECEEHEAGAYESRGLPPRRLPRVKDTRELWEHIRLVSVEIDQEPGTVYLEFDSDLLGDLPELFVTISKGKVADASVRL